MSFPNTDATLELTVIDTPGWGDVETLEETWHPILDTLEGKFAEYEKLVGARASAEKLGDEDPRVHVCFYFIAAHRFVASLPFCLLFISSPQTVTAPHSF